MMKFTVLWIASIFSLSHQQQGQPHIVVVMVDDLGFNDLSYKGSDEIPTPNIDALAYNGAILKRFYTPPLCTPSRSSFMTGKYPFKIGMQHYVIPNDEPWGLSPDDKVLPEYLKEAGYSTHLIGKWHLGFFQEKYTPTHRGFDSFFGYLGAYFDYWDYTLQMFDHNYARGRDLRRNLTSADDLNNTYATELFTAEAVDTILNHDNTVPMYLQLNHLAPHAGNQDYPVQAPQDVINNFTYIADTTRRTLAAMITVLDRGIGDLVEALRDNNMLQNTIIVFYSDNGGPVEGFSSTGASNYPLRGQKFTAWEGASRVNALVYAPFMTQQKSTRNQLMHVSDLVPTLVGLAGVTVNSSANLDGINQWNVISNNVAQVRTKVVDFDDSWGYGFYLEYPYKLVDGDVGSTGWLSTNNFGNNVSPSTYASRVLNSKASTVIKSIQTSANYLTATKIASLRNSAKVTCSTKANKQACNVNSLCLFDIYADPCEQDDLSTTSSTLMTSLTAKFNTAKASAVPTRRVYSDAACDPINFSNHWNWWQQDS